MKTKELNKQAELERYAKACEYPGPLNSEQVEAALEQYLEALKIKRAVVRIEADWEPEDYPSLRRTALEIAEQIGVKGLAALDARDALAARDALDARAALDALDARDARDARVALDARAALDARVALDAVGSLRRFCKWLVQTRGWWTWNWDLSWIATTYIGSTTPTVEAWSKPLYEAFCSGCWFLFWTDDTLYWVAKPTVHLDKTSNTRRLHNDSYAAIESDVENLYYWRGVAVPAFVVVKPEWITVGHIKTEENAEVRRIMIERYGWSRYLVDSGAKELHRDDFGILYRSEIPGDEAMVAVKVVNSTPEPDGSFKDYLIRVPPNMERARQAVAWTFYKEENEYAPCIET